MEIQTATKLRDSSKKGPRANQHSPSIRPHSKSRQLAKIDYRTSEGLIVKGLRRDLIKHLGGQPTAIERVLIERCCWLQIRLAMLDKKLATGREFTEIDSNVYLAWSNTLTRTLTRLGLKPSKPNNTSTNASLNQYFKSFTDGDAA
jgi:hypothetical protein